MWINPVPYRLKPTTDSMSFRDMLPDETGLPLSPHPGSFGAVRKHHVHEGIDLYCPVSTPVYAVESGIVVAVIPFTGPQVGMNWWLETQAVMVEGKSGVVLYGEIDPAPLSIGQHVQQGDHIGSVKQVLIHDKGRPMSMLHLELYVAGTKDAHEWKNVRPDALLDPTDMLMTVTYKGTHP